MTTPITERLKSYEDACTLLNRQPLTLEQFNFLPETDRQAMYSLHRILTGIEAINEGHVFDWNNYDEYKYYPWWDMETYDDNPVPGSGFSLGGVGCDSANSDVGARLITRSDAHARHIAEIFFEDYRNWIKK